MRVRWLVWLPVALWCGALLLLRDPPLTSPSIGAIVACTGADEFAVAWLDGDRVRLLRLDEQGRSMGPRQDWPARTGETYQLIETSDGVLVFAREWRRTVEFSGLPLPPLRLHGEGEWLLRRHSDDGIEVLEPEVESKAVLDRGRWQTEPLQRGHTDDGAVITDLPGCGGGAFLDRNTRTVKGYADYNAFDLALPLIHPERARLVVEGGGKLVAYDPDALHVVEIDTTNRTARRVDTPTLMRGERCLDRRGMLGATSVLRERFDDGSSRLLLERHGPSTAETIAPATGDVPRRHRPWLRGLLPLSLIAAAWMTLRVLLRLRHLRRDDAVSGTLASDGLDAGGTITLRRADGQLVTVFLEGAAVLRGSALDRPGLSLDLVPGAPVAVTGRIESGPAYRDGVHLRATRGDLVLVGCTLAAARARLRLQLAAWVGALTIATTVLSLLATR